MKDIKKVNEFLENLESSRGYVFIKHNFPHIVAGIEAKAGTLEFSKYIENLMFEGRENKWREFPKMICNTLVEISAKHEKLLNEINQN